MSSPEVDSNGIKWLFAHGTQTTIPQSRDNPGDHRWSHDTPGAGKGYEVTWIITPDGVTPGTGGDAGHTALKHGGPNHSGDCGGGYSEDGTCCCWYDIGIRANGDLQFQTERPHPSNHDFDGHPLFNNVGHEMEGHSTGLKIIAYPHKTGGTAEDGGIHIKFYINSDALTSGVPNNNWRLAADIFDTGQILGDGYEWPDYQELEVRNSDTDESGFFHDSVYFRFLTDADLQALRSGDPGGGGGTTIPPPPSTGGTAPGLGAVINTTYPIPSNNEWLVSDAEKVIKDTLERGKLPARNVDFANEWYCVIGPVDAILRDDKSAQTGTGGGTTTTSGVFIQFIALGCFSVGPNDFGTPDILGSMTATLSEEIAENIVNPITSDGQGRGGWFGDVKDPNDPDIGSSATVTTHRGIGDWPCDYAKDHSYVDNYSDGLYVEAYWSNRHNNCIIPGVAMSDLGTSTAITYHGGGVMTDAVINLIFFGSEWNNQSSPSRNQVIAAVKDKLLNSDKQFFDELDQYGGVNAPIFGTAVTNTTVAYAANNGAVNRAKILEVINNTLNSGLLPKTGVNFSNQIYIVIARKDTNLDPNYYGYQSWYQSPFTATGATAQETPTSGSVVDISHGDTTEPRTTYPPNTNPVNRSGIQITAIMITINTVVGYPDITARQLFDLVAAEEMVEVQTDPFFDGWNAPAGGETAEGQIGDEPCDFSGGPGDEPEIDTYSDGFCAEAYWSNRHNNCVLPGIVADDNGNSTRVTYHLGLIQKHPKIILIFWGHAWETRTATPTKTQLISDIRDKLLGTDSQYFSELNQYSGIGIPVWGAAYQQNNFVPSTISDNSFDQAFQAVEDLFARGVISPTNVDFDDTQFILITEYGKESNDFSGSHTWGTIDVNFGSGTTTPPPTGTPPPSSQFPIISEGHDCFKPTLTLPGTGGGVIPPDTGGVPPPGASVIKPIVAWGVIQVVDPATSIIHSSIPDWNGNNTITRPLAKAMIQSQVNTDPFERFGPMGWARSLGNTIGSSPCRFSDTLDNVHVYSDGLGVEAYWSNLANNCMVPGRGDPDLGTSTAITNHGGRIMKNPLIVLIFWGADWSTRVTVPTVASITGEVKDKLLDEDNEYFGQLGQYGGCGTPQFGASVINTNVAIPSDLDSITTLMAMAVVKSTLQSGALPTSIIDFNNTWFCVIPPYPSNILHPVNTTTNIGEWYDVFQPTIIIPGGTGNEEGGGTDPNDLDTITGTISFKRDINVLRTSACAGTDLPPPNPEDPPVDPPGGGTGTAKFYTVTGTSSQKEISNESSSDDRTRIVEKINSSSSAMNGKLLKQADVLLKKESGTTAVTPLVYFKIWNSSHAVVYTSPTTFTPNSLTTSFVGKTFDCSTNTHTLVVGDEVGIEFTGTDPDEFIYTAYQTSEGTGSSGSYSAYLEGSSWDNQTSRRTSMTLWE